MVKTLTQPKLDGGEKRVVFNLEDHEHASEMIGVFIRVLVMMSGLKLKSIGSATLDKQELDRGAEPDKAYYIQNQPAVAGKTIDLECDPPPDLVVEVDITHTDIDKNRLYAALGVPEFWRYNGREWKIYQLEGDRYQAVSSSPTFPVLEKSDLYSFLEKAKQDEIEAELWLKAHIQKKLS